MFLDIIPGTIAKILITLNIAPVTILEKKIIF